MRRTTSFLALSSLVVAAAIGCNGGAKISKLTDSPPSGINWNGGPTFSAPLTTVAPYTGKDEVVLAAQEEFPNASEFHRKVVLRSCGPLTGVCHNQKEYPDLRTPYNFVSIIDAPCNVQSGTIEGVYDRCERVGDRIDLDDQGEGLEIGFVEWIPNESGGEPKVSETMPGLHIYLAEPISVDKNAYRQTARFIRNFIEDGKVQKLSYARLEAKFHTFDGGKHLVAVVDDYRVDEVNALLQVGIEQGDLNRNGIFGARPNAEGKVTGPVKLIQRGNPETSYLIARLRGHMEGEAIPGSRMPLANPPFSRTEMLAMFCFVEGLPDAGDVNLDSPIDYAGCSYITPEQQKLLDVEGDGVGFKDRIAPLLESNCGGCHSAERAEGDLVLAGSELYDNIVSKESPHDPMKRKYVEPGDPSKSYLYLKLTGDLSIDGDAMPLDPLLGTRKLSDASLAYISNWIKDGAQP